MSESLRPHGLKPTRLLCPWDFPGKNTGVGCHFFLQGIFPTQGLKLGLLHCRQILYCLSYQGSPRIGLVLLYSFDFYLRNSFSLHTQPCLQLPTMFFCHFHKTEDNKYSPAPNLFTVPTQCVRGIIEAVSVC